MQVEVKQFHHHTNPRRPFILIAALAAAAALFLLTRTAKGETVAPAAASHLDVQSIFSAATDFIQNAFDTTDYQRRWQTETWGVAPTWFHISADLILGAIYILIGAILIYMHRQRRDSPFAKLIKIFGMFLIVCGAAYLLDSAMFWWPAYRLAILTRLAAAALSIFVAAVFIPAAPKIAALRAPSRSNRRSLNAEKPNSNSGESTPSLRA